MKFIADLHIHSHFSRATSKSSNLLGLAAWAAVKGIQLVGTGDFTHPGWFAHLHDHLIPAEPGLFRLNPALGLDYQSQLPQEIPAAVSPETIRFILSAEISSIYKRGGQVHKVHNLLYVPDLAAAQRVNATLATIGNITADGRPILGLDSRDLLEILLEKAPEGFLVPAHIWTPWFSLFGSKSGFDSVAECFGDLSEHVFALETGLSSDPAMNRMISALDRFSLLSNSDCHSPAKLGREANIFTTDLSFFALRDALRSPLDAKGQQVFTATIEFFPEEGKYHGDGHRQCGICLEPAETQAKKGLCPNCGKPLTIGVLHRVMELADRAAPVLPPGHPAVHSLIPLQEIVGELLAVGPSSKRVIQGYGRLIREFGSEFTLLLDTPIEDIQARGYALLAEAIKRVRQSQVLRKPGYDGEFGVIRVFSEGERATLCGQGQLFDGAGPKRKPVADKRQRFIVPEAPAAEPAAAATQVLNTEQQSVVTSEAPYILVQAGPGSGKTHTLVSRVVRVAEQSTRPCTVITFTNKAAAEIQERLAASLHSSVKRPMTGTFHGYCLTQLRRDIPELQVVGPEERVMILRELFPDLGDNARTELAQAISEMRHGKLSPHPLELEQYRAALLQRQQIDIDAVIPAVVVLLRQGGQAGEVIRTVTGHLFVDEFQDVNQAQYELVSLLAQTSTVFAIGDPDQAIYGFRGSDPRWFHTFRDQLHPECYHLIRNYRSGPTIIRAAEQLISQNPHPVPGAAMLPCASQPGTITLQQCANPMNEALFVAEQIEHYVGGTSHRVLDRMEETGQESLAFGDIGVLYRTSRQGEVLASVLTKQGMPFQQVDLDAFYTQGSCRLLYFWILLLAGQADSSQVLALIEAELEADVPLLTRVQHELWASSLHKTVTPDLLANLDIGDAYRADFKLFYQDALRLQEKSLQGSVGILIDALGARYHLDPHQPDLAQLRNLALTLGGTLSSFASYLRTFSDSIVYDKRAEAITLATLHAAKGLEFPMVFIVGAEEDLLPLRPRATLTTEALVTHIEEERRLFYVGMTRAITTLSLSWCAQRPSFSGAPVARAVSRFIQELPAKSLKLPVGRPGKGKRRADHHQLSLFS